MPIGLTCLQCAMLLRPSLTYHQRRGTAQRPGPTVTDKHDGNGME